MFCFVSKLPAFQRFYLLFSSASERSDETTSPASVQPTGHPDISISSARSLRSGSFDLFSSGCLHFHYLPCFLSLSLSLSVTMVHPPFSSHPASWCQALFQDIFKFKGERLLALRQLSTSRLSPKKLLNGRAILGTTSQVYNTHTGWLWTSQFTFSPLTGVVCPLHNKV